MQTPFNKPHLTNREKEYILDVLHSKKLAGNGKYTAKCHEFLKDKFKFNQCFLTHSCSSALEMAALLCELKAGDEVIIPAFAYPTTASSFTHLGVRILFADCEKDMPHISVSTISKLITQNTKVIVIIHYGGLGFQVEAIKELADMHSILLIEDAAHAINAKYNDKYLGTFGHLSTFSYHQTKNIHSGEGGMLVVNDASLVSKAYEIWQEGTNKHRFDSGEVDTYTWVSKGSSFQPSEITAAFLFAQLESLDIISDKRKTQWEYYFYNLSQLEKENHITLPSTSSHGHNGHIFYIKLNSAAERSLLLQELKEYNIQATFHYQSLHLSPFWLKKNERVQLIEAEAWSNQILRLPIFHSLTASDQDMIVDKIVQFFE